MTDRRTLAALAAGHTCADFCQGAMPALVPFLVHRAGLSFSSTGALLLVMSVTSSLLQPVIGAWADRRSAGWTVPAGVAVGGVGIAAVGVAGSFAAMACAVAVAGVGIALFHPLAARRAVEVSRDRPGGGLGLFAVGGSAGFTLAPVLIAPAVSVLGLAGTLVALVPTLPVALMLSRVAAVPAASPVGVRRVERGVDRPRAFALLAGIASLRAGAYFGLQAYVAAAVIQRLHTSAAVGDAVLAALLAAGAAGTLAGGRLADRVGHHTVLAASLALTLPAVALLQLAPSVPTVVPAAALAGAAVVGGYTATVVLGQRLLPRRQTLAAGMTLGFAMGAGGLTVAALGPLADQAGPAAALWVCGGLAVLAAFLTRVLAASGPARAPVPVRLG